MIASNVSKRYAKAFFDVAGEENKYEEYYHELRHFSAVIEENTKLKEFLLNPVFEKADKKSVVDKILSKFELSFSTVSFIRLLVDKGRIGGIGEIEGKYRILMDDALGIAKVQVKTAFPLTPELFVRLKQGLESLTGRKVEMQVEEDASLLGGIVVRVRDRLYDGSIKMQLDNMMKLLREEI